MTAPGVETRMSQLAYKFALDPTPAQAQGLASHVGGARFAYNWGIARVIAALEQREAEAADGGESTTPVPRHMELCKEWTLWKDTAEWTDRDTGEVTQGVPWVSSNSVSTYQAALRDADGAWQNFHASNRGERKGRRVGRPRFKSKNTARKSFQTHGDVGMASAVRVKLPVIGAVTVMSDDSRHPAMTRARRRHGGQRHTGNRRRSRQLWRQLQASARNAQTAARLLTAARGDIEVPDAVEALNQIADARAGARAVAEAQERIDKATIALDKATTDKRRAQTRKWLDNATAALDKAQARTASRTDRWTANKLAVLERTGRLNPQTAEDLITVYGLDAPPPDDTGLSTQDRLRAHFEWTARAEAAQILRTVSLQARIVRATVSLGADGLWWVSMTCEQPVQFRTTPTARQRANGAAGIDLGVGALAWVSGPGRPRIHNPTPLANALAELRTAQKWLSRCEPDSARRTKAKALVGRIHADVARLREATAHRVTTRLAKRYQALGVEGWDVQKLMTKGRTPGVPRRVEKARNRALADAGLGAFRNQLELKTPRYGSKLTITQPGEPTGRTCSACGQVKTKPVPPHHEAFTCESCGHTLPRRLNTARVLATKARKAAVAAASGSPNGGSAQSRGEDVRPEVLTHQGQPSMNRAATPRHSRDGTPDP